MIESRQGSFAKLGFQPLKKPIFEEVKEVQESPDSMPTFHRDLENISKKLGNLKLDSAMES